MEVSVDPDLDLGFNEVWNHAILDGRKLSFRS